MVYASGLGPYQLFGGKLKKKTFGGMKRMRSDKIGEGTSRKEQQGPLICLLMMKSRKTKP